MIKDLKELDPTFRETVEKVLADLAQWCAVHLPGRHPVVIETYRPQSRQDELYAQGRTKPGKKVTWTRHSKHTERKAVDIGFSEHNGKGLWDAPESAWEYYGHCARVYGLEWGGDWKTPDCPHCQTDA